MLKVRRKARPRLVCWIVYRKHFLQEMNVPDTMSPPLRFLQWQLLKAICYSREQHPATSLIVCWLTENCYPTMLFNSALQGSFPGGAGRTEHTATLATSHPGSQRRVRGWRCRLSERITFLQIPFHSWFPLFSWAKLPCRRTMQWSPLIWQDIWVDLNKFRARALEIEILGSNPVLSLATAWHWWLSGSSFLR